MTEDKDKKQEEVKYPVGEENLTIGGIKNFRDFEMDKQMERFENLLIEINKEFNNLKNLIYWHNYKPKHNLDQGQGLGTK